MVRTILLQEPLSKFYMQWAEFYDHFLEKLGLFEYGIGGKVLHLRL